MYSKQQLLFLQNLITEQISSTYTYDSCLIRKSFFLFVTLFAEMIVAEQTVGVALSKNIVSIRVHPCMHVFTYVDTREYPYIVSLPYHLVS